MGWNPPLTHRQFLTWQLWLETELNEPTKTEHYLMQIAYFIIACNSKEGKGPDIEKLKIKFRSRQEVPEYQSPTSVEEATALEIAKWSYFLGVPKTEDGKEVHNGGN